MHELSVAQEIVQVVEQYFSPSRAAITTVKVRVGALAGILPQPLQAAFDLASQETSARGARLEIESVPALYRCNQCGYLLETDRALTICPHCAGFDLRLISGTELDVTEIELAE